MIPPQHHDYRVLVLLQNAWMPTRDKADRLAKFLQEPGGKNYNVFVSLCMNTKTGRNLQKIFAPYRLDDIWEQHHPTFGQSLGETGRRQQVFVGDTTAQVGVGSRSVVKPDPAYVRRLLDWAKPDVILACGKQAAEVCWQMNLHPRIETHHPAARFIPNQTTLWERIGPHLFQEGHRERTHLTSSSVLLETGNPHIVHVQNLFYS